MIQQTDQIHGKSVLVAIKTEIRKRTQQKHRKITENVENGPQNGSPDAVIFWSSGSFFLCQTALGAQMAPKPPPRAPKTSPSLEFHRFWVDFGRFFDDFLYHVGYFLSGLPHYFFGYLELSFSNFWPQVQMCWGRPQGSVRSQKSAMWPTFCRACLFVFVTSSPTFQVLTIDFSGSSVELLANCGRRHGGGYAEGKWITLITIFEYQ